MTISQLLLVTLLIPSIATAADQRIVFSGAILEPTCGVVVSRQTTVGNGARSLPTQRSTCAASNNATANSPIYVLSGRRLSDVESDHVLEYFDAYVRAGRPDAVDPTLLTQTYD
jgi:hypothetical protein